MNIQHGKYFIKSNSGIGGGYIIFEKSNAINKKTMNHTYHSSIERCLQELFERKIHASKVKTIKELILEIQAMRREIKQLSTL